MLLDKIGTDDDNKRLMKQIITGFCCSANLILEMTSYENIWDEICAMGGSAQKVVGWAIMDWKAETLRRDKLDYEIARNKPTISRHWILLRQRCPVLTFRTAV